MAVREFYIGSMGPFLYDDDDKYPGTSIKVGPLRFVGALAGSLLRISSDGVAGGGQDVDELVVNKLRLTGGDAPASSTDTGTPFEIRVTEDYLYICIAENSWARIALTW